MSTKRAASTKYEAGKALSDLYLFARHVELHSKHGPRGTGADGPCDDWCLKCEANRILAATGIGTKDWRKR